MVDRFVETTRKGWFSRMGSSLGGVLIGLLIFIVAFPLLFWNEGRAVRRAKDLSYGKDAVVTVKPDKPNPKNNGKLIHVAGGAKPTKAPVDPVFGVTADALKLARNVEMYQWNETTRTSSKTKVGGSEETTKEYSYEKQWSSKHIDSGRFRKPAGHENPASMRYDSATFVAKTTTLGGFTLAPSFVDELDASTKLEIRTAKLPAGGVIYGGGIYVGDPQSASIGDTRITFSTAPSGVVTVVGGQHKAMIDAYKDEELNGDIALIERGKKSSDEMFKSAQEANYFLTWMLRVLGFILMFAGLRLAARPLSALGSIIPFIGKAIGFGTGLIAFFLALALSAITIAIAWIFYRPLLGIVLFAGAIAALAAAVTLAKRASES